MSFSGFNVSWVELEGVLVEQTGSFVDQVGLNMMRLEEYESFREASEEARYLAVRYGEDVLLRRMAGRWQVMVEKWVFWEVMHEQTDESERDPGEAIHEWGEEVTV